MIITQIPFSGACDERSSFTAAVICSRAAGNAPFPNPRMERLSFRWVVVVILVCTRTENLRASDRGPNDPRVHSAASPGHVQPVSTDAKQSPVSDPPDHPAAVVVRCHADSMELLVQADLFNRGLQVDGRHLHLGPSPAAEGSACAATPSGEAGFTIWAPLMDCGMSRSSTEEKIVYSARLSYSPEPPRVGAVLRLDAAAIPVECHYEKKYSLSGVSLRPTWIPSVSVASAENRIGFDLQLMTANWDFRRRFYSYFLGDPLYFEVSARLLHHVPLRVYVDHCVATATPDVAAPVRYDFIEHSGCLADTFLTNSSSHFLPRLNENKLRFQIDAFRFYREPDNQIFVTCYVKAVPVPAAVSSENRACSLMENRWRSVDGHDQACTSCGMSRRAALAWTNAPQHSSAQNGREHQPPRYSPGGAHQSQGSRLMGGAQAEAGRTVQLGPITVLSPGSDSRMGTESSST
ncbi:Zona pellucida sperm-binding protein 3 [Takifugu flavidus]|uniref:Zona pellucida sperm-binding protein 3 n=2 Tax=Takifugu flavidus TaxID=433684 RepID=A0A5C6P3Q2_9TELE|nr:Zona pellucida sperm-binding protein 3 [Takifugu flavidus]